MADAGVLIRKLENFAPLSGDDRGALDALAAHEGSLHGLSETAR